MAVDLDFLTQIINVNWGGEEFVYVGEQSPGPNLHFCTSGWSEDGLKWNYNSDFRVDGETGLSCCISGELNNKSAIIAGGSRVFIPDEFHALFGPIVAVSYDNGQHWEDTGLPMLDLVINPMPDFLGRQGSCHAVGYDPDQKTFYATVAYLEHTTDAVAATIWRVLMYAMSGGNWSLESNVSVDGSDGLPLPPYPQKIRLCDALHFSGSEGQIIHTRADIDYRSCNGHGQIMKGTDEDGNEITVEIDHDKLLIKGKEVSVPDIEQIISACFGNGIIIAAGYASNGPAVYRSQNFGKSWSLVIEIQSDENGSVGAVSFS